MAKIKQLTQSIEKFNSDLPKTKNITKILSKDHNLTATKAGLLDQLKPYAIL